VAFQSSSTDFIHTAHLATDGNPDTFWLSASSDSEWFYADSGKNYPISKVVVLWHEQATRSLLLHSSQDSREWRLVGAIEASDKHVDELLVENNARFVCLQESASGGRGYSTAGFDVYGHGPRTPTARKHLVINPGDGRLNLSSFWRLQNASLVRGSDGATVSNPGFRDADWITATVPRTVLSSYLDSGCIPDPEYGDRQYKISNSLATNKYWYRAEFVVLERDAGELSWLNFKGINYRHGIFVHSHKTGNIQGSVVRGRSNITNLVKMDHKTSLSGLVHRLDHPGAVKTQGLTYYRHNGSEAGLDRSTFVSSVGWDGILRSRTKHRYKRR
jgi:hypothetical protein